MTDPIIAAAHFLASQLEYVRHQPWADEFLDDVDACARVLRSTTDGPAPKRYLGPCGMDLEAGAATCPAACVCRSGALGAVPAVCQGCACLTGCHGSAVEAGPCDGDVYARDGGRTGTCRRCGATVDTAERRRQLAELVRDGAYRAVDIEDAYGIRAGTIRVWAHRGRLRSYWRTETGIIADWVDPPDGVHRDRLHYLGDVLDLDDLAAARRAEAAAIRARRAAARAASDERLSA